MIRIAIQLLILTVMDVCIVLYLSDLNGSKRLSEYQLIIIGIVTAIIHFLLLYVWPPKV